MSLQGHCWVSSVPKYRSWAEGRLGAGSLHKAKLNRDLLGVQKFFCLDHLVSLDAPVSWYKKYQSPPKCEDSLIGAWVWSWKGKSWQWKL